MVNFGRCLLNLLCLLQITMLWYYYAYHHELCSVQSVRPVLVNSKVVFINSLARFEVLIVVMLKIGVFLDVMMHHWMSSSQQVRWSYRLQNVRNCLAQQHKGTSKKTWSLVITLFGWRMPAWKAVFLHASQKVSPVVFVSSSLFTYILTSILSPTSDCLWCSNLVRPRSDLKILYL